MWDENCVWDKNYEMRHAFLVYVGRKIINLSGWVVPPATSERALKEIYGVQPTQEILGVCHPWGESRHTVP